MRSLLAILVVSALVLALVGSSAGPEVDGNSTKRRPGSGPAASGTAALDPDVALRILAPEPTRMMSQLARMETASVPPEVVRVLRRESAVIGRAGVDLERDLLARLSFVVISLERTCPPPAILSCRPAIRIFGRLRERPDPELQGKLRTSLIAALRDAGFRGVAADSSPRGDQLRGRVTARGETLGRWHVSDGVLEIVTGGLSLSGGAAAPREGSQPAVKVEMNPRTLETLLDDPSS